MTSGNSILPGDLGGETGGAEGNTSHVVLLVDGGGSLAGDLAGVAGHNGVDVGLGLLAVAVSVGKSSGTRSGSSGEYVGRRRSMRRGHHVAIDESSTATLVKGGGDEWWYFTWERTFQ